VKTILSIATLVFTVLNLHAQGTVNFGNVGTATGITNGLTGMPVSGTAFRASLYYLPFVEGVPMPTSEQFVIALRPDTTSFLATGQFAAGTRSTPATTMPGGIAWFQVKAWEVAFGTSYEEALANPDRTSGRGPLAGTSNIVKVRTGNGSTIAPGSLVASPEPGFGGLKGFFVLCPLPEPSTVGLGFLALGALVLLWRKK
jgi:hypothetical protein